MDEAVRWARLLVTLGVEVYRAYQAGDTTRTVGEVFEAVTEDVDELERLEETRFGG